MLQGPTLQGPMLQGPTLQGPTLQGPTLQGPCAGVSYFRLFKYTQQHTEDLTENNIELRTS
jgi:hypothetical protein